MRGLGIRVLLEPLRNHPLGIGLVKLLPTQAWERRPSLSFNLCAFIFLSSLLLGGGTRGGFLSDAILELLAIPVFLLSLSSLVAVPWSDNQRPAERALMLCLAIVLLPLLQLVPLPPWLWEHLPHRDEIAAIFDLTGGARPWLPVSVTPTATWLSLLSLLPPLAVFLGVVQLSYRERRLLSLVFLAVGLGSAMLGLMQVAQGASSALRFFTVTNENEAVGFFANRNHLAALLYVLLLYAAAWATEAAFTAGSWRDLRHLETSSVAALTASLLAVIVFIAAETITRSRAGLGLTIVGMFASVALPFTDRRRTSGSTPVKLIAGAMIIALLLAVQFALYRVLDRFGIDSLADARVVFARNTLTAAWAFMPFGSGFGSFVSVYPMFEQARDALANIYVNHAHNDIAEICLEGGAVAMLLMVAFAAWFVAQTRKVWLRRSKQMRAADVLLARAATIAIALLAVHSFVDYPLRTDAMMAVFAFSCGLLIEPVRGDEAETSFMPAVERVFRREPAAVWQPAATVDTVEDMAPTSAPVAPRRPDLAPAAPPLAVPRPVGRWGEGIDWPEEWNQVKVREAGVRGKNETDA